MHNQHEPELEQLLNGNCDRIEVVLMMAKIVATVGGAQVTSRTITYRIRPSLGTRVGRIHTLAPEFAAALDVPACRVSQAGNTFLLEAPRPDPPPLSFEPFWKTILDQHTVPPVSALLGQADDGTPILARLTAPDAPHILLAGTTGSGKTELLRVIALSLALTNPVASLRLVIIDPANKKLAQLGRLRHCLWGPLTSGAGATIALNRLLDQLDRPSPTPHIMVVIDELADLIMMTESAAIPALTRLTQRGREAGIHVIAATQKPSAAVLGSLMKANFPVRLCAHVTSADDARVATGQPGTGAEKLPGLGAFLVVHGGTMQRFQAPLIQDLPHILDNLPHAHHNNETRIGPHPLDLVRPIATPHPDPPIDDDTRLARKILAWEHWPGRRTDDGNDYRWGFTSAACSYLFDRDAAGTWYRRTVRAIALAEEIDDNRYRAGMPVPDTTQGGYAEVAPAPPPSLYNPVTGSHKPLCSPARNTTTGTPDHLFREDIP